METGSLRIFCSQFHIVLGVVFQLRLVAGRTRVAVGAGSRVMKPGGSSRDFRK